METKLYPKIIDKDIIGNADRDVVDDVFKVKHFKAASTPHPQTPEYQSKLDFTAELESKSPPQVQPCKTRKGDFDYAVPTRFYPAAQDEVSPPRRWKTKKLPEVFKMKKDSGWWRTQFQSIGLTESKSKINFDSEN